MALYTDPILDEIMRQVQGDRPRPQGRITQTSSFGLGTPAAPAVPGEIAGPPRPSFGARLSQAFRNPSAVRVPFTPTWPQLFRGGAAGLVAGSVLPLASQLKDLHEGYYASAYGTPNVTLTPEFAERVKAAGGERAFASQVLSGGRTVNPQPGFTPVPGAEPVTGADVEDAALGARQDLTPVRTDLDAADILSRRQAVPPGTGAIQASGAPPRLIDARTSPEFLAANYGARPTSNLAGDFTGALLNLKQVSGDAARRAAEAKAASQLLAAQGTYGRGAAAATTAQISAALAAEHLRKNPGDLEGASAILHGRATGAGMKPTIPMGGVGLNPQRDPSLVFDPRSQTTRLVYPTRPVTEANIAATMKERKLTREQAIARYKAEGFDVSGLK